MRRATVSSVVVLAMATYLGVDEPDDGGDSQGDEEHHEGLIHGARIVAMSDIAGHAACRSPGTPPLPVGRLSLSVGPVPDGRRRACLLLACSAGGGRSCAGTLDQ